MLELSLPTFSPPYHYDKHVFTNIIINFFLHIILPSNQQQHKTLLHISFHSIFTSMKNTRHARLFHLQWNFSTLRWLCTTTMPTTKLDSKQCTSRFLLNDWYAARIYFGFYLFSCAALLPAREAAHNANVPLLLF